MKTTNEINFNIPELIKNSQNTYEGDLIYYFRTIINNAKNLNNSYHNFRHIFHVLWMCYDACLFYLPKGLMNPREARNLLIAALFHDFDHSGKTGRDDLEISRAIEGLKKYCHESDIPYIDEIYNLIQGTMFPHKTESTELSLCGQILRDADLSQTLSSSWIQQVIFGLGEEMNLSPVEMLKNQKAFLSTIHFSTDWAKNTFGQSVIDSKINEAETLLSFLQE